MKKRWPLLILGVGNVICSDDGVGPCAVRMLETMHMIPDDVLLLDGGTLGLSLLPYIEDAECVIILDAVRVEDDPGTMVRFEGSDVMQAVRMRLSPHQVGVADLLDAAALRGYFPENVVLLGIVPESIGLGVKLTTEVAKSLPLLVARAVDEAARLGFALTGRSPHENVSTRAPSADRLPSWSDRPRCTGAIPEV